MYMKQPELAFDPVDYSLAIQTSTPPELLADVSFATHAAYTATAHSIGGRARALTYDDVKSSPSCLFVARHITDSLTNLDKGYEADIQGVYFPPNNVFHLVSTVRAPALTSELIVADATWQQFLPRRERGNRFIEAVLGVKHPEVLVGTPNEVTQMARHIGFSTEQAAMWDVF
jgi:hypothetical protein